MSGRPSNDPIEKISKNLMSMSDAEDITEYYRESGSEDKPIMIDAVLKNLKEHAGGALSEVLEAHLEFLTEQVSYGSLDTTQVDKIYTYFASEKSLVESIGKISFADVIINSSPVIQDEALNQLAVREDRESLRILYDSNPEMKEKINSLIAKQVPQPQSQKSFFLKMDDSGRPPLHPKTSEKLKAYRDSKTRG